MDKLTEIELLKWQAANKDVQIANLSRDTLGAALVAKYGKPGESGFQIGTDGTILRAPAASPSIVTAKTPRKVK